VGGDQITTYNEGGEQYEVHIRAVEGNRQTAAAIGQLTVPSSTVGSVPLNNIARLTAGTAPSEINRLNRQRQVTVFAGLLQGYSQVPAMDAMTRAAEGISMGPGYSTRFAGGPRARRAAQNFRWHSASARVHTDSGGAVRIVAASHHDPPVAALTLLFALRHHHHGAVAQHLLGAGLLVLFGVVKKNSILQIDHANQLRDHGMERDAAVLQASRYRLRPILMTTLAFVAGMIPLVLSSGVGSATNRAIGFVIIGGQSLVLLLTLVATPVAYSLFDDLSKVRFRWWRRAAAPATASLLALALALWPVPLMAQTPAPAPGIQTAQVPLPQAGTLLKLTKDDAIRMAMQNNPDLAISRFDLAIGDAQVAAAPGRRADLCPVLRTTASRRRTSSGRRGYPDNLWSSNVRSVSCSLGRRQLYGRSRRRADDNRQPADESESRARCGAVARLLAAAPARFQDRSGARAARSQPAQQAAPREPVS
jgi:hypothetical protein